MTTVLAVDPGKNTGWAFFKDGRLTQTGLIDYSDFKEGASTFYTANILVIEIPQVYQQRHWKGDPDDLIEVALIAGSIMCTCLCENTIRVYPHQWKGNRPKGIDNKATLKLLDSKELAVFELNASDTKAHNIIDAIGIGLWHLGRR